MKPTKAQIIWYRDQTTKGWTDETAPLELRLPKVINSDISFQLQFGPHENVKHEQNKTRKHHKEQSITTQTIDNTKYPFQWI